MNKFCKIPVDVMVELTELMARINNGRSEQEISRYLGRVDYVWNKWELAPIDQYSIHVEND